MARDAIEAVKSSEEEARTFLQNAKDASKEFKKESRFLAEEKYRQVLLEAKEKAKQLKDTAVEEGEDIARPILQKGKEEAEKLLDMKDEDLEAGVNIIIERIVNANGNS